MKKLLLKKKARVGLIYRPDSSAALNLGQAIAKWLKQRGYPVFTGPGQRTLKGTLKCRSNTDFLKCNLIIVLGGDGTYLRAVRLLEGHPVPILGVNLGSLGFLTPTRAEDLFSTVEQTLENKMALMPRSIIRVRVLHKGKHPLEFLALNDIVLERGPFSQLITMEIYSEKHLVGEVKADGLILASPTGSTAYNLSAGGPILHPQVRAFVVTPIAPHSLTNRPLIFPDDQELKFKMVSKVHGRIQRAHLVVDGQKAAEIDPDDEVTISRSKADHLMVYAPGTNYFKLLREKMKFGDRS
jgi:NAD+ kinase